VVTDWTVFDRPDLIDAISTPRAGLPDAREVQLAVDGVHCASCAGRIERLLQGVASQVRVNLTAKTVEFVFVPQQATLSSIARLLDEAGFAPQVLAQDASVPGQKVRDRHVIARIGIAAIGAMQVMMLAWPLYFDAAAIDAGTTALLAWSQWLLATPVVFYSGWPFIDGAWRSLRERRLGMDVPVAASILIAYFASAARTLVGHGDLYFDAATMFVLLLGAGRYLEGRTRARAGERLRLLASRRALTALRIQDGRPFEVPISALSPGDQIQVPPGAAVPVDGILLEHAAELDESLLTGESRPVPHRGGDGVLGGSLNISPHAIRLRATGVGAQTRLAQIERLLRDAHAQRPPSQQLTDRIAAHFVLGVLILAVAAALWWWPQDSDRAISVLLAVLVASCPCALSLAVPAVRAAASSRLAASGVLLVHPDALARLTEVDTVLLDKTGTLTRSELKLVHEHILRDDGQGSPREIAAALEHGLSHPIAKAFKVYGNRTAGQVVLDPNGGISGVVGGHRYWIGALPDIAGPGSDAWPSSADQSGCTWLMLRGDGGPIALFGLSAEIRPEASAVLAQLRSRGLALELVSGDSEEAVSSLARRLDFPGSRARQTPEDKLALLRTLQQQGRTVMAVGDGINDAPFLGAADVAVAMPAGAALAQARADAILIGDSLDGLVQLFELAHDARRRSVENLAWALGYNLAIIPLAMSGTLTPWIAALGMSLSSLLVVGNALRLLPARKLRGVERTPNGWV
jgi:Cu2+-exporting ATPase